MKKVLLVYKNRGETPLQTIHRVKEVAPTLRSEKISYAGRLDPMAEGLLLLLIGDANKERADYEKLQKTYIVEILLGVSTDSYDLLGEITAVREQNSLQVEMIDETLQALTGEHELPYPPYSSKPVQGKPLYFWAKHNLIHQITIPIKRMVFSSINKDSIKAISSKEVAETCLSVIPFLSGDFRLEVIRNQWLSFQRNYKNNHFTVLKIHVTCSSGSYMRSLANIFGEKVGIPSLALSIKRTQIGDYSLESADLLDGDVLVQ